MFSSPVNCYLQVNWRCVVTLIGTRVKRKEKSWRAEIGTVSQNKRSGLDRANCATVCAYTQQTVRKLSPFIYPGRRWCQEQTECESSSHPSLSLSPGPHTYPSVLQRGDVSEVLVPSEFTATWDAGLFIQSPGLLSGFVYRGEGKISPFLNTRSICGWFLFTFRGHLYLVNIVLLFSFYDIFFPTFPQMTRVNSETTKKELHYHLIEGWMVVWTVVSRDVTRWPTANRHSHSALCVCVCECELYHNEHFYIVRNQ